MRYFKKVTLAVLFISLLSACVSKVGFREGIDSFRVEEYRSAFVRLKPYAIKGNPDAQYAVGYMYYYGKGVVEDRKKAWFWITAAANAGQAQAKEALEILDGGPMK